MNFFEYALLVFWLYTSFNGFSRGLFLQLIDISATVLGVILGVLLLDNTVVFIQTNFPSIKHGLTVFAFILTFVVIYFGIHLIGKIIKNILSLTPIGFIDSIVGFVLGATKGLFFSGFIINALIKIPYIAEQKFISSATIVQFNIKFVKIVLGWIPGMEGFI